jgi:hypothetical protein
MTTTERLHSALEAGITWDVCIVGAGLAGLNALFAAGQYLSAGDRILLVDRREQVGGMWVDTYPHVRLHQPHPMFTAGNIDWDIDKAPSYLATKPEVLGQFQRCLDAVRRRVQVFELFGWTLQAHRETDGMVRATCRSIDGCQVTVNVKRLIKAEGLNIGRNPPLTLSSRRVRSVSPDACDVRRSHLQATRTPIWIVGGGKTAMDTAHSLITSDPGREINLAAGAGTFFLNRDRLFPTGWRRWLGGTPMGALSAAVACRFDGANEEQVGDWYRRRYGISVTGDARNHLFGLLSQTEAATIAHGLNDVVMDYVQDVVDAGDETLLTFRSGATQAIPAGSWIVNCTGYVLRGDSHYEPYASETGRVLSVNSRSATMLLTSAAGYFLTHLLFQGRLDDTPLYELDLQHLYGESKTAMPFAALTLTQHNLGILAERLPANVFRDCGADLDRWYPLPRRAVATWKSTLWDRRAREQQRRTLDTVRQRFGVRCGPLVATAARGA